MADASGDVTCPQCDGIGTYMVTTIAQVQLDYWAPRVAKAVPVRCKLCKHTGTVTRATYMRWRLEGG